MFKQTFACTRSDQQERIERRTSMTERESERKKQKRERIMFAVLPRQAHVDNSKCERNGRSQELTERTETETPTTARYPKVNVQRP